MPVSPRTLAVLLSLSLAFPLLTLPQPAAAQQPPAPLTVDAIYGHGSLTGNAPDGLTWSPDSKHLSYLDAGQLIDLDPETGKIHVMISRAKMAAFAQGSATEQERDHRARYSMPDYIWAPSSTHLLFDANGRLWLFDLKNGTGIQLAFANQAAGVDPKFSPNGELLAFVRNHSLSVVSLKIPGNPMYSLFDSRKDDTLNGEVDWVYAEELDVRSNFFWSPDSKSIAFLQTNDANVTPYPLTDWIPTRTQVNVQRYPQAGDPNPDVRIGIVGAQGGKTSWIKLPIAAGQDYVPRFGWADRKTIWAEVITRDHKHRRIYFADAATGVARLALDLTDDKFFPEDYDLTVRDGLIALTHWGDGHTHIYLYSYDRANPATAKLEKQLTSGDFEVSKILRVDPEQKSIDYLSSEGNPLELQAWRVTFDGARKQLTTGAGYHDASFSPDGSHFFDKHSTRITPDAYTLCTVGAACRGFWEPHSLEALNLHAPQQLEVKAHDGATLYATLLLPEGVTNPASVPLIVNPYGGPGPMNVANKWSSALFFDSLLAQHGFAVLHADNRGTGMRGRDFAQAAYHNFGPVQFEDQLTVIDAALARYPQLDSKRLGWWGWSWGGTFTLYALSHSDRFRAGVSVAPVTDWRNYDSVYTERYMSLPSDFPEGYKDFSVVNSAAKLHGRLLLVHGTGDDNVHMQNSIQYIQKLIEAQVPYDLQLYPRKTHSIAGRDVRTHLYTRILAQFEQYLKPPME